MNPTTALRHAHELSIHQLAKRMKVTSTVIECTELGMFNSIPSCYRKAFPEIDAETHKAYQAWRTETRRKSSWVATEPNLLVFVKANSTKDREFCRKLCVQQASLYRLLTGQRRKLPEDWWKALTDIGRPIEWIFELDKSFDDR